MPGNDGVYAARKRKKPAANIEKPPTGKTNPSKRHRDRLNTELDHLTSLLPFSEEVRGRLDKLSVLRLSVGYLKVKSYFHGSPAGRETGESAAADGGPAEEPEPGRLKHSTPKEREATCSSLCKRQKWTSCVTGWSQFLRGRTSSPGFKWFRVGCDDRWHNLLHIPDHPGFPGLPSDGLSRSSVSLVPQYVPPENSSFLERSFCCRLRCLQDNTSGFLTLNFNGRLKYMHLQGNKEADGTSAPPQLALFAIATPLNPPSVMAIRTKTLFFQTKHRMDFAPLGIDTRGKLVLGYSEVELVTHGSGYQFIHAADMMYCADNHLRMMKTGDSGFTIFRLLIKTGQWLWVQASARIVFKDGRPDFIIARQKALTNEEGEEHLYQRRKQLPFNLATGEGVLYDISLDAFSMPGLAFSGAPGMTEPTTEKPLDPASILGSLRRQDHSVYTQPQKPSPQLPIFTQTEDSDFEQPLEQAFLDSHALLSVPGQIQVSQKRFITEDLTSKAMIESLEQILGDIGDGRMEGLEVEEKELRDWENTIVRMNNEREDTSRELNHILANDVFSYVEEALRRETGAGDVQGSDQTGAFVSGNRLSIQVQHPGQWQPMTDMKSGFAEQTLLGEELCDVGSSTGLKEAFQGDSHRVAHTPTPTQFHNTHQGHTSLLWPPSSSSNRLCGNQMVSTQSCYAVHSQPDVTQQSWHLSAQNTNNIHSSHQSCSEVTDQSVRYTLSQPGLQQTYVGPQLQSPSLWQQQQLPQSFHHHTTTMAASRPDTAAGVNKQDMMQSSGPNAHVAACKDVGNISLVRLSGDNAGLGAARSEYPPENGSLQSTFFC
ncbi:aryl hydrocarbon receptor-like isoform X2 [Micropterus dolomieu]|uniref:aryl hydrocarbon receptor-like isoform X2 n=1 Tax=Micropterus dolomieu TaxID=147949 RepID=UPI001E8DEE28|nr:aryl hydrocarbon receptor-like isoform X2 [Micropterus dolomieu]